MKRKPCGNDMGEVDDLNEWAHSRLLKNFLLPHSSGHFARRFAKTSNSQAPEWELLGFAGRS